jgi:DNA-binding transcriptional ArsR family regulator
MHQSLFQALSDPTRLRIVDAMRAGELAVSEIVVQVEIRQSGVSRHLRILQEAGLVAMRPVGQRRLYSLTRAPFDALGEWLDTYRRMWESRLDRLDAALDQRTAAHHAAVHSPQTNTTESSA